MLGTMIVKPRKESVGKKEHSNLTSGRLQSRADQGRKRRVGREKSRPVQGSLESLGKKKPHSPDRRGNWRVGGSETEGTSWKTWEGSDLIRFSWSSRDRSVGKWPMKKREKNGGGEGRRGTKGGSGKSAHGGKRG